MNRANFATPISIAPFGLRTVIAGTTRWVSHEAWSDSQTAWFADMRSKSHANFLKTPKKIRRKNKNIDPQYGAWLLTTVDAPTDPIAWAELHNYVGGFSHGFLMVDFEGHNAPNIHLELLLTAIALWGKGDLVDVYFASGPKLSIESANTCEIITLLEDADMMGARAAFERTQTQRVDLYEWMQLPKVQQYTQDLKSLSKLAEAMRQKEAREQGTGRRPARGFMERLFNPWKR